MAIFSLQHTRASFLVPFISQYISHLLCLSVFEQHMQRQTKIFKTRKIPILYWPWGPPTYFDTTIPPNPLHPHYQCQPQHPSMLYLSHLSHTQTKGQEMGLGQKLTTWAFLTTWVKSSWVNLIQVNKGPESFLKKS